MRNSQPHNNALRLTYIQTQFMLLLYIIIFTSTHKVKNKGNRKKLTQMANYHENIKECVFFGKIR
jgi:hypothetical protein